MTSFKYSFFLESLPKCRDKSFINRFKESFLRWVVWITLHVLGKPSFYELIVGAIYIRETRSFMIAVLELLNIRIWCLEVLGSSITRRYLPVTIQEAYNSLKVLLWAELRGIPSYQETSWTLQYMQCVLKRAPNEALKGYIGMLRSEKGYSPNMFSSL